VAGFSSALLPYQVALMKCRASAGNGLRRSRRSVRAAIGRKHCHVSRVACVRRRTATTANRVEPLHFIPNPSEYGSAPARRPTTVGPNDFVLVSEFPPAQGTRKLGHSDKTGSVHHLRPSRVGHVARRGRRVAPSSWHADTLLRAGLWCGARKPELGTHGGMPCGFGLKVIPERRASTPRKPALT
jgi:hypothetical protein